MRRVESANTVATKSPAQLKSRWTKKMPRKPWLGVLQIVPALPPNSSAKLISGKDSRAEYDFSTFYVESDRIYDQALDEIRSGAKRSHWIWYIMPQLLVHCRSSTAKHYGIISLKEAERYLQDDKLGARLREITNEALRQLQDGGVHINKLMGSHIDAMKMLSCATLFSYACTGNSEDGEIFQLLMEQCSAQLNRTDDATIQFCEQSLETISSDSIRGP